MITLGPLQFVSKSALAQVQTVPAGDDVTIRLSISPSIVEFGGASHDIGFVQLVSNSTGQPVLATRDMEIELSSSSQDIASVPARVTISKGTDYARFAVTVTDLKGESDISALFGNQIVTKTFAVVAAGSQIPSNINLVVDLPSSRMQIGSEMPVSVYLENNGEIVQAPEDLAVTFDYERSLVRLSSSNVVIEKGSYYALTTVRSLEKSGNAFIKASSSNPVLDTVTTIEVSQTQPASIKLYVFPDKVARSEKTVDVFVGLADAAGNPTVASNDIKLDMFASSLGVQNIGSANAVIKKGEYGFHAKQSIVFFEAQNVTIGATVPGLGVSTDNFEVVDEPLVASHPKALNKQLIVSVVTAGTPSDATSIVSYQVNAVEQDDDDDADLNGDGEVDADDIHAIDELTEGELYPIESSLLYSTNQGNLNVVTSDISMLRVIDTGSIIPGGSYGTATVASGRQPGSVVVSVSLANMASSSNSMEVTGGLTPVQTAIYSPAGLATDDNYRVPFNQAGNADLFVLTLDSSGRPARSEDGVEYLVKPTNELTEIAPDGTFGSLQIHSSQFSSSEATAVISAIPVGVNSDNLLTVESTFHTIFFSSITGKVSFPSDSIIGFSKSHPIGVVQLTDVFGNPLLASEDIKVTLTSSRSGTLPVTSITIPMGKSFAHFDVMTGGRSESLTISAFAEGVRSTSLELDSVLADLSGSFVPGDVLAATQPSIVAVATDEGTSVLWGVPSSFQIASKEDKAMTYDPVANAYIAKAEVVAPSPGDFTIDVTLLKDGFKPTRLSSLMTFEAYQIPLTLALFHDAPSIEYGQPVMMSIRVVDANSKPVPDAIVRINPGPNATAVPTAATTDANGLVTFEYTPTGPEARGIVVATAEKAGYTMGLKTTNFEVENVPLVLPQWLMFGIVGAMAAGAGAGGIYYVKRPKVEQPVRRQRARRVAETEEEFSE
jgi:hypothetical protein